MEYHLQGLQVLLEVSRGPLGDRPQRPQKCCHFRAKHGSCLEMGNTEGRSEVGCFI